MGGRRQQGMAGGDAPLSRECAGLQSCRGARSKQPASQDCGCQRRADSQRRRLQRFIAQKQPMKAFVIGWTEAVIKALKQRQVVLIVDETKLKDVLGVMVVGVVYEGRCIPRPGDEARRDLRSQRPGL